MDTLLTSKLRETVYGVAVIKIMAMQVVLSNLKSRPRRLILLFFITTFLDSHISLP